MKKGGNLLLTGCLILWVLVVHVMTGCSVTRENKDKVRDLDFTGWQQQCLLSGQPYRMGELVK